MVFVRVFGMNVLFLNSHEAVNELLHKRGALYSDRAHLVLACDMYVTSDCGIRMEIETTLTTGPALETASRSPDTATSSSWSGSS